MAIARAKSVSVGALAGGGQSGAPVLTEQALNNISTVATAADSVRLPPGVNGMILWGVNSTANAAAVFPSSGETINALSANASLSIAAGKSFSAFCPTDGKWYVNLSA